jgi:hypothetical protein
VNLTDQDLIDVSVSIVGIKNQSPDKNIPIITNEEITQRFISYISKFEDNSTEYLHAVRINLFTDDILNIINEYKELEIIVRSHCPFYGTSNITRKTYKNSKNGNVLNNSHKFNTGNSTSAV